MTIKCACNHCGGHIEFESEYAGETVQCPLCNRDTVLFMPPPPEETPPLIPAPVVDKRVIVVPSVVERGSATFPSVELAYWIMVLALAFAGLIFLLFDTAAPGSEVVNLGRIANKLGAIMLCIGVASVGGFLLINYRLQTVKDTAVPRSDVPQLGLCCLVPKGLPMSATSLPADFKTSAGEAEAQNTEGVLRLRTLGGYTRGEGDWPSALLSFQKAVERNNPKAHCNLGVCHHTRWMVRWDLATALHHYRKAAQGGEPVAMNNIGTLFENGHAVVQDLSEAERWYRMAASRGEYIAQFNLGRLLHADKRYFEAAKWLKLASRQEYAPATAKLELMTLSLTAEQLEELERIQVDTA